MIASPPALSAVTPLLRWAGSKKKILPRLLAGCPSNAARYIEPFAGSGALFFRLRPRIAILADINESLVNMYRQVRSDPEGIFSELSSLPIGSDHYYNLRSEFSHCTNPKRRAALLLYLNRYCFNGLYRTNHAGQFNVPYGGSRNGKLPNLSHLRSVSKALAKTKLIADDFENVIAGHVKHRDLVYLDPPYAAVKKKRTFRYYGDKNFSKLDLSRLSGTLSLIDSKGAHFILSYGYSAEAQSMFGGWRTSKVSVLRHIAGFAGARRNSYELIVTNIEKQR